jgi:hypothetical protein
MSKEILNPDTADLIRETLIVIVGLVVRFFELRNRKNKE